MKRYAVIVAGGSGNRMNSAVPKQFMDLAGKPILMHTMQRLHDFDPEMDLILVLPSAHMNTWKELCRSHSFLTIHSLVEGGENRFHSVKNGIAAISETEAVVGIHDGVRPFVSNETLVRCFETAERTGNAVPAVTMNESVRWVEGNTNKYLDRESIKVIQTPQCFHLSQLRSAFQQSYSPSFTDDATVVEKTGIPITLVEGNVANIKITTPSDLRVAAVILSDLI